MSDSSRDCSASDTKLRLVIVALRRLDGQSLAALCRECADFDILCVTTAAAEALEVCRSQPPHVLLLEATFNDDGLYEVARFVRTEQPLPVLLLDDEVNYFRLTTALMLPGGGYFTRLATFDELADGIRQAASGKPAFDPLVVGSVKRTAGRWRLAASGRLSKLAKLTPRETEILQLIASGKTVRDCAALLALAPSTVDNHKSRLMKKLGVHKSQELTRLAIREGLIRV